MHTQRKVASCALGAALTASALVVAGPVACAAGPPDVWQAAGAANTVGGNLAGHYGADRMSVSSCDTKGAARTCAVEVVRLCCQSEEDNGSDCTWNVTVRRSRHGLRRTTKIAGCEEDQTFPPVRTPLKARRSKARAYRIAGKVAVRRARAIFADETAVAGCNTNHSAMRACRVSVDHSEGGAICQYLVLVPPLHSRRHVRTMPLGPCGSN
jgi:hypothetical protein